MIRCWVTGVEYCRCGGRCHEPPKPHCSTRGQHDGYHDVTCIDCGRILRPEDIDCGLCEECYYKDHAPPHPGS